LVNEQGVIATSGISIGYLIAVYPCCDGRAVRSGNSVQRGCPYKYVGRNSLCEHRCRDSK
jgi:hypothetical protein